MEAEYIHRHRPLNDDDTLTLKMLSIMTAAEGLLEIESGGNGRHSPRPEFPSADQDF